MPGRSDNEDEKSSHLASESETSPRRKKERKKREAGEGRIKDKSLNVAIFLKRREWVGGKGERERNRGGVVGERRKEKKNAEREEKRGGRPSNETIR